MTEAVRAPLSETRTAPLPWSTRWSLLRRVRIFAFLFAIGCAWQFVSTVVLDAKIPGYQPFSGYFGFGAATGGASSEQAVRASAIALRNEPSCL